MIAITDNSYGVIPVRQVGDSWEVFLIRQYSQIGNDSFWVMPKGHSETGESGQETAVRELKEETGFTLEQLLEQPTFTLEYSFVHDGVQVNKTVTFFVGLITKSKPKLDTKEVREADWFSLEAAIDRLDYVDTKDMFLKAKKFIETELSTSMK